MLAYVEKLLAVAILGLLVACGPKLPNYDYTKEPNPRLSEYVIGVTDGLSINVWKNAQLSSNVVVRPDGTITMPLIGDIYAVGKTPTELRKEIGKRLAEFVKLGDSEITVAVTNVSSYRIVVSGEVVRPGVVSSANYLSIAEAIAQSGGFTRFADRDKITLLRRDKAGNIRRIPIVYKFIEDGSHPEMNLVMMAGDSLNIP